MGFRFTTLPARFDIAGVQGAANGVFNFVNNGFSTYTGTIDSILVSKGIAGAVQVVSAEMVVTT